jgi:hypothetical protein
MAKYPRKPAGYDYFKLFPAQYGYDVESLAKGHLGDLRVEDLAPLLQSWFFFGLLTKVFAGLGIHIKETHFVQAKSDGALVISTKNLHTYITYWRAVAQYSSYDEKVRQRHLTSSCLKFLNATLNAVVGENLQYPGDSLNLAPPCVAVLQSLFILGDILHNTERKIYPNKIAPFRWSATIFKQTLLEAGWCVAETSLLSETCGPSALLYLSTFDRFVLGRRHRFCDEFHGCRANEMDFETYETKHTLDCSRVNCENIGPDIEEVASVLRNGGIPVLTLDFSVPSSSVEVMKYERKNDFNNEYHNEFVAISHVWSDGLGNLRENKLPRCQLVRLQRLVNNIYHFENCLVPFWVDTICVPLNPMLKDLAIQRMADTYKFADATFVLDNSFQYTTSKASSLELMMRLKYSLWMTRLWTFQGGRLSRDLWFQFQDKAVHSSTFTSFASRPTNMLEIVSDSMLQEDDEDLLKQPCGLHIMRALSAGINPIAQKSLDRYAKMPKQDDPREEEIRLNMPQALEVASREQAISDVWKPKLALVDPQAIVSWKDFECRVELVRNIDTVHSHAFGDIWMLKGIAHYSFLDDHTDKAQARIHRDEKREHRFIDVCRGLTGRSTSHIEDETICLSVLFSLDIPKLQTLVVIPWRIKDMLKRIRDFILYYQVITKRDIYRKK